MCVCAHFISVVRGFQTHLQLGIYDLSYSFYQRQSVSVRSLFCLLTALSISGSNSSSASNLASNKATPPRPAAPAVTPRKTIKTWVSCSLPSQVPYCIYAGQIGWGTCELLQHHSPSVSLRCCFLGCLFWTAVASCVVAGTAWGKGGMYRSPALCCSGDGC